MNVVRIALLILVFDILDHISLFGSSAGQLLEWPAVRIGATSVHEAGFVKVNGKDLTNVVAISAGRSHALALTSDGTVVEWMFKASGQATGLGSQNADTPGRFVTIGGWIINDIAAISAGDGFSLALKSNGTVVAWGTEHNHGTELPAGLSNVVAIAAGWTCGLALKRDGTIVGWGNPGVPAGLSNIVAVAGGRAWYGHGIALKSDGTVVEWGPNGLLTATPNGLGNISAVAEGANFALGLKQDGTVFGWGANGSGQATGKPTAISPYEASGVVEPDGQILGDVIAIAAGGEYGLALKRDSTVVAWGRIEGKEPNIPGQLSGVVAIAAGGGFCLAITTNSSALNFPK